MYQSGDPKAEAEGESSKSIERIYWKIWTDSLALPPKYHRYADTGTGTGTAIQ